MPEQPRCDQDERTGRGNGEDARQVEMVACGQHHDGRHHRRKDERRMIQWLISAVVIGRLIDIVILARGPRSERQHDDDSRHANEMTMAVRTSACGSGSVWTGTSFRSGGKLRTSRPEAKRKRLTA